jgi:hypothetical protein
MSVAIVALQRARSSFVSLGRRENVAIAGLLWFVSSFGSFTLLGSLLRARTHHRALGGVVFAVCGLAVAVLLALGSARTVSILVRLSRPARWGVGAVASAVFVMATHANVLYDHVARLSLSERARVVDGLAFALCALLASVSSLANRRGAALLGPPFAVVILVLGIASLLSCTALRDSFEQRAPLVFWLLALLFPH